MTTDALLASTDREAALSRAFVAAVAAAAGYCLSEPDIDRDSIDIQIHAGGHLRPTIQAQLKATINLREVAGNYRFTLKRKNYDDLRIPTMNPRLLIVLHLPREEADWLSVSPTELMMRHCAYWISLRGMAEIDQESVTIEVPAENRLDVSGLRVLMERARNGPIA